MPLRNFRPSSIVYKASSLSRLVCTRHWNGNRRQFDSRHLNCESLPQWRKIMETQRLLTILTTVNLALLGYQVAQPRLASASTADVPGVLRGSALEIVDARGKIRASISVLPEDPNVIWKGKPYPETVLLRLISPDGRPNVKLGASQRGAALLIGGESD